MVDTETETPVLVVGHGDVFGVILKTYVDPQSQEAQEAATRMHGCIDDAIENRGKQTIIWSTLKGEILDPRDLKAVEKTLLDVVMVLHIDNDNSNYDHAQCSVKDVANVMRYIAEAWYIQTQPRKHNKKKSTTVSENHDLIEAAISAINFCHSLDHADHKKASESFEKYIDILTNYAKHMFDGIVNINC